LVAIQFWSVVGSAEKGSEHPLAHAILQRAELEGANLVLPEDFETVAGGGISCRVNRVDVLIGNRVFLNNHNIIPSRLSEETAQNWESDGETVVFVCFGNECVGLISIADTIKVSLILPYLLKFSLNVFFFFIFFILFNSHFY
jgi:Cu+-exporting ATPase